jgi:hypothetical protein
MIQKNTTVVVKAAHINLSPIGFLRYADHFYQAGESFECEDKFSPVHYYLYCHSIELALKAFLLAKEIPIEILKKKIGHNLSKALKKARNLGIDKLILLTNEQEKQIINADKYYASKGFEYFKVYNAVRGYSDLPNLEILRQICAEITKKLHDFCWEATNQKADQ